MRTLEQPKCRSRSWLFASAMVTVAIDWTRRYALVRLHTPLHVTSYVRLRP